MSTKTFFYTWVTAVNECNNNSINLFFRLFFNFLILNASFFIHNNNFAHISLWKLFLSLLKNLFLICMQKLSNERAFNCIKKSFPFNKQFSLQSISIHEFSTHNLAITAKLFHPTYRKSAILCHLYLSTNTINR